MASPVSGGILGRMRTLCVYCGSSSGVNPALREAACQLGTRLGETRRRLVYGGGRVGLMGTLADAALAAGGEVVGVIPRAMVAREWAHSGLTRLHIVKSMHERKAMMAELADAFVALPGGIGTMEEFFEIWTWAQLGLHHKPIGLLNVAGFFDPLASFLAGLVREQFVRPEIHGMLVVADQSADLLARMEAFQPLPIPKWIDAEET